jgi:hypothetical protein
METVSCEQGSFYRLATCDNNNDVTWAQVNKPVGVASAKTPNGIPGSFILLAGVPSEFIPFI